MKIKSSLAALCVAATIGLFAAPAFAGQHAGNSVYARLSMANTLRSHTQHMARLSCYIYGGVDVETQKQVLLEDRIDFETFSRALIEGNADLNLEVERSERVRRAVRTVREDWPMFSHHIGRVADGEVVEAGWMAEIDMFSVNLLQDTNELSTRIANVYGESFQDVPLIMLLTVEMAGRQIMRTEKAGKEACLIGTGVNVIGNRASLEQTVTLFSATLGALINGFPGLIMAAPNEELRGDLLEVQANWIVVETLLKTLYLGGEITGDDRIIVASGLESVALQMSHIAKKYETVMQE